MQDTCQRLEGANGRAICFLNNKNSAVSGTKTLQGRHTMHRFGKKIALFCRFAIESAPDWT